jgi:hypothetical protein
MDTGVSKNSGIHISKLIWRFVHGTAKHILTIDWHDM